MLHGEFSFFEFLNLRLPGPFGQIVLTLIRDVTQETGSEKSENSNDEALAARRGIARRPENFNPRIVLKAGYNWAPFEAEARHGE
jgi:hypothetical protein